MLSGVELQRCWISSGFNGYDYDCCKNRVRNVYYPSLSKPCPYYYRCVGRRVVYGRCVVKQCVTMSGNCGCRESYCDRYNGWQSTVLQRQLRLLQWRSLVSLSLFEEILNKRSIVDRRFREHTSTYSLVTSTTM
ncbi:hypothetical protein LSAT2_017307 [Lamellibrachia satsuma]|nr:hypothetical protein LSAT2_017307 [Lamellibrachia satsuma]